MVETGNQNIVDFELTFIEFGYITGKVTLKGGTGTVDSVLIIAESIATGQFTTSPDPAGLYCFEELEVCIYDITASLDGYTSVTIDSVEVLASQITSDVDMTLINWIVIPNTQFNMVLFSTATLDGKFTDDSESNQLAAFGPYGDNDCRGIATWLEGNHPQWNGYWDLNGFWYFTIVSNNNSGTEEIHFKLYETETDSIYDFAETISFVDGDVKSKDLIAQHIMNQDLNLFEEWNWISFNVHPADSSINSVFDTLTPFDIFQVKNQTRASTYFPGLGWLGDLNYITKGDGYLVNMNNTLNDFSINGIGINPVINPISLTQSWNWVSYYPKTTFPLQQSLVSIAGNAEIIKNQTQSAVYYEGSWIGDLLQMEPGVGYKICMIDTSTLIYPENAGRKSQSVITDGDNNTGWKLISGTQYNMITIAEIIIDEKIVNFDNYSIGVFDEEHNCRSIGKKENDFWYFTIVGNEENEELNFRAYEIQNDIIYKSNEKIKFINDVIIGSPDKPINITFMKPPEATNIKFTLAQYPNPIKSQAVINYSLPETEFVNLSIYNVKGQLVQTLVDKYQEANNYTINWDVSILSSGVYFYKLSCGDNTIIKRFLIMN